MEEILELYKEEDESVEIIEDGDWIDDGKYSFKETVIKYEGKYYQIDESRSGSYYTDYDYFDPTIIEVTPEDVVRTVRVWRPVKLGK